MGMENVGLHMSTAMFFESVPDEYVDVNLDKWEFDENERVVPIIIPRNYLNLYNFGFVTKPEPAAIVGRGDGYG